MAKFTVDTHLFRELGELLVGRDSTALIELIKNAYDADATRVVIHGEHLDDSDRGRISIEDNGVGMSSNAFHTGFLRIASRIKDKDDRRSGLLRRRYTGAKGIGRLAAHKLARRLDLRSITRASGSQYNIIKAWIDWDEIEEYETLDALEGSSAIGFKELQSIEDEDTGTTLVLSRLRQSWNAPELASFFAEVQSFEAPHLLISTLPESIVTGSTLFESPTIREIDSPVSNTCSDFSVLLTGDFASEDQYWDVLSTNFHWLLEIRSTICSDAIQYAISPTVNLLRSNPEAVGYEISIPYNRSSTGPHFDARIFVREGSVRGGRDQRVWASKSSGVRVFLEGFRILPYGEQNDDWLSIDADYTRRKRQLELLKEFEDNIQIDADDNEGLMRLAHNNYIGGVFLTHRGGADLKVLVNREGFVPNASFHELVRLVRIGIDLCTRVRARAAYSKRQHRKSDRLGARFKTVSGRAGAMSPTGTHASAQARILVDSVTEAAEGLKSAESSLASGDVERARKSASESGRILHELSSYAHEIAAERSLLWVLASIGTQMAAFVHEVNVLLGNAQSIEQAITEFADRTEHPRSVRAELQMLRRSVSALRLGLERQASYLLDVSTPNSRRRRVRLPLSTSLESASRLVLPEAERRRIVIENEIPIDFRSPPMFPAEIIAVLTNLLTNAIKAAGTDGRIRVSAIRSKECATLLMENTGTAIDLGDSERWFRPFESTTSEVDPVLGQGMGLGLTITRRMLESYGATIAFVTPEAPYSSAVQIVFPAGTER